MLLCRSLLLCCCWCVAVDVFLLVWCLKPFNKDVLIDHERRFGDCRRRLNHKPCRLDRHFQGYFVYRLFTPPTVAEDEVAAVVADNGSGTCDIEFDGDVVSREVTPSTVDKRKMPGTMGQRDSHVRDEAQRKPSFLTLEFSIEHVDNGSGVCSAGCASDDAHPFRHNEIVQVHWKETRQPGCGEAGDSLLLLDSLTPVVSGDLRYA